MPLDGRAGRGWRRELSTRNVDTSSNVSGALGGSVNSHSGRGSAATRVLDIPQSASGRSSSNAHHRSGSPDAPTMSHRKAHGAAAAQAESSGGGGGHEKGDRRNHQAGATNQSLLSILLSTAYVATIASLVKPDDEEDVVIRKHIIGVGTFFGVPALTILLAEAAAYMYSPPMLLGVLVLLVLIGASVAVYVVAFRLETVPRWLFNVAASVPMTCALVVQFTVPGSGLFASTASTMLFANHTIGAAKVGIVFFSTSVLVLCMYNIIALRHDWPVPGYNVKIPVIEFTIAVYDAMSVLLYFFVYDFYEHLRQRQRELREEQDEVIISAARQLLVFDLEGLTNVYASVKDETKDERMLELLDTFTKTVAQFRPHVPHYVLSRSAALDGGGDASPDVATRADAASSRHPRRLDHRSATRDDVGSSRSMSYVARAQDDVQSSRTMRSEVASLMRQPDQTMSPIFLARAKPLITRRVTIALLEYWIPPEFSTTKGLELLVDTLLSKADENQGSVHSVVGDTAIVSWNAIRSVSSMEKLACRFCAEVTWHMRNEFERQFLQRQQLNGSTGMTPRPMLAPPMSAFGMDMSNSNIGSLPRIAGGVMTGDARVCFAGTKTCEFCMSYSWQPVLLGLKKLATSFHMICCDATTRSSAGSRLKTRAIGSIGISSGMGLSGAKGALASHSGMDKSHVSKSDRPLVELQQSPQTTHMDVSSNPGAITNSFEVNDESIPAFDLVAYEIVAVLSKDAAAAQPANFGVERANLSTASGMMRSSFAVPQSSSFFPGTLDTGDEDDDDITMNLVVGSPQPSSGLNSRLQSKQKKPDDPDELLTKAVHLAANDKKYAEAAKKFRDVLDLLKARTVGEPSPRGQQSKSVPDFPVFGATNARTSNTGVTRGVDPLDEYAYEDSGNPVLTMPLPAQAAEANMLKISRPTEGLVSALTTPQLITLVTRLHAQAVKCAENPNVPFAESVVSVV